MNDIKKGIDESSSFYEKSFLSFDYKLADYNYLTLKPFFQGDLALELGPASGYMTKHLVNDFKNLHIIEGSELLLKEIPDYSNVKKTYSLFEDFETDVRYDTIIMSHVLEHVSDTLMVLNKIKAWLKEDGVFLVSVPNAKSIHRLAAVEMGMLTSIYELNSRDKELGHYRVYDLDSLTNDIQFAGFTIREKGGIFLKPLSNGQIENNWNDQMIDGFYKLGKKFKENCAEIYAVCGK